jgi:murein tripeptide amidase MpaA
MQEFMRKLMNKFIFPLSYTESHKFYRREWISPAAVTYVIDHLVANWDSETLDMKAIDWYILPVMNPDGYAYTHNGDRLWRKNKRRSSNRFCTGVDLNRNYGHKWGGKLCHAYCAYKN